MKGYWLLLVPFSVAAVGAIRFIGDYTPGAIFTVADALRLILGLAVLMSACYLTGRFDGEEEERGKK